MCKALRLSLLAMLLKVAPAYTHTAHMRLLYFVGLLFGQIALVNPNQVCASHVFPPLAGEILYLPDAPQKNTVFTYCLQLFVAQLKISISSKL